jgi:hypothetical protein
MRWGAPSGVRAARSEKDGALRTDVRAGTRAAEVPRAIRCASAPGDGGADRHEEVLWSTSEFQGTPSGGSPFLP